MWVGLDLGGTKIEGIRLEAGGEVVARERVPTPRGDPSALLDAVAGLVSRLEGERGPLPVGIGMPGSLSPRTGLVRNSNLVELNGTPFGERLRERLDRTVAVTNDANAFALAEAVDGAAAGARVVFGVILGTGVGGGVVVDGAVIEGRDGIAGEWGHIAMPRLRDDEWPPTRCWCGRRGCVETFLSGGALGRLHGARTGEALDARAVSARAMAGDRDAAETLSIYAERLGRALAMVANLLDPDVIVLGGGVSRVDAIYGPAQEALWREASSDDCRTPILRPKHGDAAGVIGAAWLARGRTGPITRPQAVRPQRGGPGFAG